MKASCGRRRVTLAHLIDARLIAPGPGTISINYNDVTHKADLLPDGYVSWDGREFAFVSHFSLAVKRKVNPGRKADDGWKCVAYNGTVLDGVKKEFEAARATRSVDAAGASSEDTDADAKTTAETMGPAVAAAAAREIAAKTAAAKLREESKPPPPPPASDAAPVKRGRGRPPGAKKWASEPGCKSCRHSKRGCKKCVKNYIPKVSLFVFSYEKLD